MRKVKSVLAIVGLVAWSGCSEQNNTIVNNGGTIQHAEQSNDVCTGCYEPPPPSPPPPLLQIALPSEDEIRNALAAWHSAQFIVCEDFVKRVQTLLDDGSEESLDAAIKRALREMGEACIKYSSKPQ